MLKVGILGAGFIAGYHVKALQSIPSVKIQAICDINKYQQEALRRSFGEINTYNNLEEMLNKEALDVVHVLLPPNLHYSAAEKILLARSHVFLEKPMGISRKECVELADLAHHTSYKIGVNHNFLFFKIYKALKQAIATGEIGPVDHLTIAWHKNLAQLRGGPFDIWMLRHPKNLILELGTHLTTALIDLIGVPSDLRAEASNPLVLPNGHLVYRHWLVTGSVGQTLVELRLSVIDGFDEHTIEARGTVGSAKVDFEKNIFVLRRHTASSRPQDLYNMATSEASQIKKQAKAGWLNYILSKGGLSRAGDPWFGSILSSIQAFYHYLETGKPDARQGSLLATEAVALCEQICQVVPVQNTKLARSHKAVIKESELLITGGTGFIGSALAHRLKEKGSHVRLISRHGGYLSDQFDVVQGDCRDRTALKKALKGIKTVYHLARGFGKEWDDYFHQQVDLTRILAEECLDAGVERLVYTGTIDSYFAGKRGDVITELTPLDPKIAVRNYYARAKAMEESLLMQMHENKLLPVVIARPGIVLGVGMSPFHWGVGMWHYGSICQLWGEGNNFLPFVWVEDVVDALIKMGEMPSLEGESFNLVDRPCLTGKEYAEALSMALQTRLEIQPTPIWKFYGYDWGKWIAKTAIQHPGRKMPAWRDWLSRCQYAHYDCMKAITKLSWNPLSERQKLIEEGINKPAREWIK